MEANLKEIYQQIVEHKLHFTYRNWKTVNMTPEMKVCWMEKAL